MRKAVNKKHKTVNENVNFNSNFDFVREKLEVKRLKTMNQETNALNDLMEKSNTSVNFSRLFIWNLILERQPEYLDII